MNLKDELKASSFKHRTNNIDLGEENEYVDVVTAEKAHELAKKYSDCRIDQFVESLFEEDIDDLVTLGRGDIIEWNYDSIKGIANVIKMKGEGGELSI